jgi:hypothetical protein
MYRIVATAIAWLALATAALAQSTPGLVNGQVPSAQQWNSYFAQKLDNANQAPGTFLAGPSNPSAPPSAPTWRPLVPTDVASLPTVASQLTNTYDAVRFCGIKADQVTDDSAALIACATTIHNIGLGGGIIQMPTTISALANEVVIPYSNISIRCYGADTVHTIGNQGVNASGGFLWTGANGGTMISFATPDGNVNGIKQSGGGVQGCYFNSGMTTSNTGAGGGLEIKSWYGGDFSNNFFYEMQTTGINMDLVTTLYDARDAQLNILSHDTCWNQASGSNNANADCVQMNGDVNAPVSGTHGTGNAANVSLNTVIALRALVDNGAGLHMFNSDHNHIFGVTGSATGTGIGIECEGTNGTAGPCRESDLHHVMAGNGITLRAAGYSNPSSGTMLDEISSQTPVTVEAGATCAEGFDDLLRFGYCTTSPLLIYLGGSQVAEFTSNLNGTLQVGTTVQINAGDIADFNNLANAGRGIEVNNGSASSAAVTYYCLGNSTFSQEACLKLNGGANTSGNGANSLNINGVGGTWLQGNGNNGLEVEPSGNVDFLGPYTQIVPTTIVASLKTCNSAAKGSRAIVTDATAPSYLATVTGLGSVTAPVFCDGTSWKAD